MCQSILNDCKIKGHAGTVNAVRFNEDSSVAISGSIDGTVKCWDLKSKRNDPIQVEIVSSKITNLKNKLLLYFSKNSIYFS